MGAGTSNRVLDRLMSSVGGPLVSRTNTITVHIGYSDYHPMTNIGYFDYFANSQFKMPTLLLYNYHLVTMPYWIL